MNESANLRHRMKAFYEDVTNRGPVALERLPELYRGDICCYTPVEHRLGFDAFRDSWLHMFESYKAFTFTDIRVIGDDFKFAFFATMTVQLGFGNPAPMPIVTLFHADEHGKVFHQVDYWDTAASLAAIYQPLQHGYQWAVGRFLGSGPFCAGDAGLPKPVGEDGCYHPTSESELIALIRQTSAERGTLRVVGSGEAVWESIVPDGFTKHARHGQRLVMLDEYQSIVRFYPNPKNEAQMLVEVQAGCNLGYAPRLGRAAPRSPAAIGNELTPNITRERSWEQSLCHALQSRGYALPDLGATSHQTVGGFVSTGSAGSTCKWSIMDAIESMRVIDGRGEVVTLSEASSEREWFAAAGVGLGLCGVISTVTFRCEPTYNVVGRQTTSKTREAPDVDFYGDADDDRPSLASFLQNTDYARLLWWPQRDFDRLVVWRAQRTQPTPSFTPKPKSQQGRFAAGKQAAASLLFTLLGNLETPPRIGQHISQIQANQASGGWNSVLSAALSSKLFDPLARLLARSAPHGINYLLSEFVPLGPDDAPVVQEFQDVWYRGLPVDNGIDAAQMPIFCSELWIPFSEAGGEAERAIAALRELFDADGTTRGCYRATGPFAIEITAAKADSRFALSPAGGARHVLRINVFWFGYNAGDPVSQFYPRFWRALDGLNYRLHWGKFLPRPDQLAPSALLARFPRWDDWKRVREQRDPRGIFLNDYWRSHLGLAETSPTRSRQSARFSDESLFVVDS